MRLQESLTHQVIFAYARAPAQHSRLRPLAFRNLDQELGKAGELRRRLFKKSTLTGERSEIILECNQE
jgi:hypothetical protein